MFVPSPAVRATLSNAESRVLVPDLRYGVGRKAYSYRGPVFWNSINQEIKDSPSQNVFKTKYIKFLLRDVNHPT